MKALILTLFLALILVLPIKAQTNYTISREVIDDSARFEASLIYVTGTQKLPCNATITVPKAHKLMIKEHAVIALEEFFDRPDLDTSELLGIIIPENEGILTNQYFIELYIKRDGFISDIDETELDFDRLGYNYRFSNYSKHRFVKWVFNPYYNSHQKLLHLPMMFCSTDDTTYFVNVCNWVLGREGYIESLIIADTSEIKSLREIQDYCKTAITFDEGYTHNDYNQLSDKLADFTIGSLSFSPSSISENKDLQFLQEHWLLISIIIVAMLMGWLLLKGRRRS